MKVTNVVSFENMAKNHGDVPVFRNREFELEFGY